MLNGRYKIFCAVGDLDESRALLTQIRHQIHQNPELSFKEAATSALVAARLEEWGYEVTRNIGGHGVVGRLKAGDSYVELAQGEVEETERPLLNHLGLRVESADDHIREAEERGLEIADIVDAENTYAVFVWGPDGIKLEYVEHKPTFSLV